MINVKQLPIHRCQTTYCITQARYWDGRIVALGNPADTIMGWCDWCEKFMCSYCAVKIDIPPEHWSYISETDNVAVLSRQHNIVPKALACRRCNTFLGVHDEILLWKRLL